MNSYSYLALGDSYTIGESVDPSQRFPVLAAKMLRDRGDFNLASPEIIATTGWTTGDLLSALHSSGPRQESYDLVTLLIGVNNQYQGRDLAEYREEFTALLQKAILLAGNRPGHVIVLSIPDYSVTPFARSMDMTRIASEIESFNIINRDVSALYRVGYLDITAESRKAAADPSLIASDELHFSGLEYRVWADMMQPLVHRVLGGDVR